MARTRWHSAFEATSFLIALGVTTILLHSGMHRTPLVIVPMLFAGAIVGMLLRQLYDARRSIELLSAWVVIAVLSAALLWLSATHRGASAA